jgi:peroxiredoxin
MRDRARISRRLAIALAATACVTVAHAQVGATGAEAAKAEKAEVGKPAPAFTLTDTGGTTHNLADFKGKTVVLEWFSPYCPWSGQKARGSVHHNGKVKSAVEKMKAVDPNVVYVLVNSTHLGKPEKEIARDSDAVLETTGVKLPILMDHDGTVGKMYGARVTPHVYVIDREGVLRYQGAVDSDRNGTDGTNYVVEAVSAIAKGETPATANTRPWGCGVKYKR